MTLKQAKKIAERIELTALALSIRAKLKLYDSVKVGK